MQQSLPSATARPDIEVVPPPVIVIAAAPAVQSDQTQEPVPVPRGLHSSTFRLIISAFYGIRWLAHGVLVTKRRHKLS